MFIGHIIWFHENFLWTVRFGGPHHPISISTFHSSLLDKIYEPTRRLIRQMYWGSLNNSSGFERLWYTVSQLKHLGLVTCDTGKASNHLYIYLTGGGGSKLPGHRALYQGLAIYRYVTFVNVTPVAENTVLKSWKLSGVGILAIKAWGPKAEGFISHSQLLKRILLKFNSSSIALLTMCIS